MELRKIFLLVTTLLLSSNAFAVCGDADQNHFVDILDAYKVARHSSGLSFLGGSPAPSTIDTAITACIDSDVTGDFNVTVLDALTIARHSMGLTSLQCANESQLCTSPTAGGPSPWQRQSFFGCLGQFNHRTGVPVGEWMFNQSRCPGICPHSIGVRYSPCQPLSFWPIPVAPNLGSGNGCEVLTPVSDFTPGDCFGGRANLQQISGINPAGMPANDGDCDNWTDTMEDCVDTGVGYALMDLSGSTPPGQFTCFYDDSASVQGLNIREFVMCRER